MASLTPEHRSGEVTKQAMTEGLINGAVVLVPSFAGVFFAMRNPNFRKYTNMQSRTALVIMPALFAFGFTSENKLIHRMEEVASEEEHSIHTIQWADRVKDASPEEIKLHDLYRQSILNSNIRLVDQTELTTYQKAANYVQSNPFKLIAAVGIPSVAYIFHHNGKGGTESLQLQLLHTRVFGQFAVICTLLGVMGMKDMMDRNGRYVTEADVEDRIQEMEATRMKLLSKADYQKSLRE